MVLVLTPPSITFRKPGPVAYLTRDLESAGRYPIVANFLSGNIHLSPLMNFRGVVALDRGCFCSDVRKSERT